MPALEPHLRLILAEVSGIDPSSIGESTPLADYGLDSTGSIDLLVRIEDAFGIHIARSAGAHGY